MRLSSKKIKIFLVLFIIGVSGIIVAVFVNYKFSSYKPEMLISAIQTKANLSIKKVHQTATRDGIKEWSLDAKTAHLIASEKKAVFDDLTVTFFLENGENGEDVYLRADQGVLNTDTQDFTVTGNVVLKNKEYRVESDELHYKHNKRILYSTIPIRISGDLLKISADSMSFELSTKKTRLTGNVEGSFSDNISL